MTTTSSTAPLSLTADGELFQPSAWMKRSLVALALLAGLAVVPTWLLIPAPIAGRGALSMLLAGVTVLAWSALRRARAQYLVGERTITHLVAGRPVRAVAFSEVRDLREVPTWWFGRRLCMTHAEGPLVVDASFFAPHGGRLYATLRYRMRPQFFRWIDDILSRGERFAVRPGARVALLAQAAAALLLGVALLDTSARWVAVPLSLWIAALQLDAAMTVVRLGPAGLSVRSLLRRRTVATGQVQNVLFQSRTRLLGRAERIVILQCERFDVRLLDSLTGFEALAGAIEGFARHRELRGLAQL